VARERMGQAAREAAAERDWEAINGRMIASYRTVIAGAGAARSARTAR
jgi:hypothetical protein